MTHAELDQALTDLSTRLRQRYGLRGRDLAEQARGLSQLPSAARQDARLLAQTARMLRHPRMSRLVDLDEAARALTDLRGALRGVDPAKARADALIRLIGLTALRLALLGASLMAFLRWQGLI